MSRSLKKGPWVDPKLLKKLAKATRGSSDIIRTWSRDSVITPEMVGYTFCVHNGKTHIPVFIIENMVGHRLGEFSPTRKFVRHGGRMQREAEAAAAAAEASKSATVQTGEAAPAAGAAPAKKEG